MICKEDSNVLVTMGFIPEGSSSFTKRFPTLWGYEIELDVDSSKEGWIRCNIYLQERDGLGVSMSVGSSSGDNVREVVKEALENIAKFGENIFTEAMALKMTEGL